MQTNFAVNIQSAGHVTTLVLSGELDLLSSPVLERAIEEAAQSDAELVVVDLRGLEFMDSTGLHLVLQAQQRAHETGRRFALIRGGEQVQRLFELSGVSDGLTIVDSPDRLFETHGSA